MMPPALPGEQSPPTLPKLRVSEVVRVSDDRGAMLAMRLRPGQVRTLANRLGGIVAARDRRLRSDQVRV